MESIVSRFVAALRREGLRVSPGESLDAVCALGSLGLGSRALVRLILRLTLVKTQADVQLFNRVFDRFFGHDPEGSDADLMQALSATGDDAVPWTNPDLINDGMTLAHVEASFDLVDLGDLQGLREIPLDELDGSEMEIRFEEYIGALEAPRPSMRTPQTPVTLAFKPPTLGRGRDLCFSAEEIEALELAVSAMLQRLKKDIRLMKQQERRGRIHVARTLRRNYRNGMVPFKLCLRRKRREKPRLVVLCDLSYSVSHASRFMLALLHTLHHRLMEARSFIFNAELVEITQLLHSSPLNSLLEDVDSGRLLDLEANSDYGRVLQSFRDRYLDSLRGRPAVIILGDARNNYGAANEWVMRELRERAACVLWLTPEDEELWSRGDCILRTYGAFCDRVEVVRGVEDLNRIVEDIFRGFVLGSGGETPKGLAGAEPEPEGPQDYRHYYTRAAGGGGGFDPEVRRSW